MIKHELTKRAIQARHLPAHEGEPCTRNGNTRFKIKAKSGTNIGMIAGFKIKIAWFAPARNFNILGLICAVRGIRRW